MATRHQKPRQRPERATAATTDWGGILERSAVGLALLLIIARPSFPSEDADTGSGLVVVALWGLVALVWAAAQAAREQVRWYARWVDVLPAVLLGIVIASAFWADTPRLAINMASEWGGLLLSYVLVRQLFREPRRQRLLVVAMLATAFALAAYGIYQAFWGLEALRADYARDRLRILESLAIVPGSPQEETFKNRLNSHEVFATFALANSLAGFLLAWLPVGLAWVVGEVLNPPRVPNSSSTNSHARDRGRMSLLLAGALAVVATIICLVLTQSRTAYVGFVIELVVLAWLFGRQLSGRWRAHLPRWSMWGVGLGIIAAITAVLFAAVERGKIDEKLITQATKSFEFRGQYWQATTRLIRDRLWTGIGPGNFRGHYLTYKLPESSEEIADPHNFVLEVCATSGVPAGLILIAMLIAAIVRMCRPSGVVARSEAPVNWFVLGAAAFGGFGLAALLSSSEPAAYAVLMIVWAIGAAIFAGAPTVWELRPSVLACAAGGLVIHLLGAGGIGMPGVAQSFWVLLALGLNAAENDREPWAVKSKLLAQLALLASAASFGCFCLLVLRPVTASRSALSLGQRQLLNHDWAGAEVQFRAACKLDTLAAEPWIELSRIQYMRWRGERGQAAEEQFGEAVRSLEAAARLAPSSVEPSRSKGELFAARAAKDERFWPRAIQAYRRCVEIYPTSALLHARLANLLWQAGEHDAARAEMKRALQLDALTPHVDKKLATQDREWIEKRLAEDKSAQDG